MSAAHDVKASTPSTTVPPGYVPGQAAFQKPAPSARLRPSTFEDVTLARIDLAIRHVLPNELARLATSYVGRDFGDQAVDFLTVAMNGSEGERVARGLGECFVASPFAGDGDALVLDVTRIGSEAGRQAVRGLLSNAGFAQLLHDHAADRGSRLLKVVWSPHGFPDCGAWRVQADFRPVAATPDELRAMAGRIAELLQSPGEPTNEMTFMLRDQFMGIARELFAAVAFAKGDITRRWRPHAKIDVTAACSRLGGAIGMASAVRAFNLLLADAAVMGALIGHAPYPAWIVRAITFPVITWMEPPARRAEGKQAASS